MDDANGLDLVANILAKALFDSCRICTAAPITFDEFRRDTNARGELVPQAGKLAGLEHQDLFVRAERVDQRRFPSTGTGGWIDDYRVFGLEHHLEAIQAGVAEISEPGPPVVHGGVVDRTKNPVGHVGRAWNLQKMSAAVKSHGGAPSSDWKSDFRIMHSFF